MWLLTLVFAFTASISACAGPGECPLFINNTATTATSTTPSISTTTTSTEWRNTSGVFDQIECLNRLMVLSLPSCECQGVMKNTSSGGIGSTTAAGAIIEVECYEGVPLIETLPRDIQKLVISGADEYQVTSLLDELENSSLTCLYEVTITNSSFPVNITWELNTRLTTLNISGNNIVDLSDVIIGNKSELRVLDLSSNRLSELPSEAFRTLTGLVRLSLRDNEIERVDERAFVGLTALEYLDISDNRLVLLPDDTLTHLASSLQTLNLSGNQLKILGGRWFETLGRLRELDVSRNGLTKAASGVLEPLPGLSVLRLAENPLMERDVSLLLGTGRLETVDASRTGLVRVPAALTRSVRALRLAGNKLTCIRDGDFDGYPLLKMLDLSDNLLYDIEEDSLGRLETLERLDLSGNKLEIVPRSLPTSLTVLNLRGNAIKTLTSEDLQGIDNLQCLFINDNEIVTIDEGALSQLLFLTKLDISNNPIRQLPANTLAGPARLSELRMSGLTFLEWEHEERGDMAFPVPTPEMLVTLDVSHSPALAAQLLTDNAALSACKSLMLLNLINTNITTLRSDLIYLLPQLNVLGLADNDWNCTADLLWLGEWIRQHREITILARCSNYSDGNFANLLLAELPPPPTTTTIALPITTTPDTTSDTSYRSFRIEKYPELLPLLTVPTNASSIESNISHTESAMENTTVLDEIPSTKLYEDANTEQEFIDNEREKPKEILDNRVNSVEREDEKISNPKSYDKSINKDVIGGIFSTEQTITNTLGKNSVKDAQNYGFSHDIANTIAEELNSRTVDPDEKPKTKLVTHPGMLVLIGAVIGAAGILTVVLSRRATIRRRDRYHRHENIEVHTLTPTMELW
ncbi:Similar to Igfals: Insulin-like growth factor-binding protein complex acid labile subunit (Mus musculus) [Cotesia congregata]|uniref:Similar to Igfals: Insulin-like growth factor-binding protein complex acid labile subunit (Mus musculus) n=1 Tax=Cotesia congregata TaxID=51543 RepID=A0A8J2HU66_COTCN|nr:Similar to Igfals: Insulin-like growth factor-binding protein complex acid labile subunit (Mus musculus) [Cotesia congregata]